MDYSWQVRPGRQRSPYTPQLSAKHQVRLKRIALGLAGLDAILLAALLISGHPFALWL